MSLCEFIDIENWKCVNNFDFVFVLILKEFFETSGVEGRQYGSPYYGPYFMGFPIIYGLGWLVVFYFLLYFVNFYIVPHVFGEYIMNH